MVKIGDLQKKRDRIEKELNKAKAAHAKQGELVKKKTAALEQAEQDIVSQLLVENKMDMKDLMAMLASKPVEEPTKINDHVAKEDHSELGGDSDEI
ncbi:hypothetical protein [Enterococcus sp. DIV0187]|uniref:hypothetical protein n=1 Tax=Enterococcus sp. DIV0187 TaxID=2774644 RepID=UPI003F267684